MHAPKAIEAMARAIRRDGLGTSSSAATAALTALCTLHPSVAAILRGEAVAVPREDAVAVRHVWNMGQIMAECGCERIGDCTKQQRCIVAAKEAAKETPDAQ